MEKPGGSAEARQLLAGQSSGRPRARAGYNDKGATSPTRGAALSGQQAVFAIPEGELLAGGLPPKKTLQVQVWIDLHYPVFRRLRNPGFFGLARVDYGTVTWPGDIDTPPRPSTRRRFRSRRRGLRDAAR